MQVYEGIVQERVVVLPEGVHLDEGLRVEVWVREAGQEPASDFWRSKMPYVRCIKNEGYEASLEVGKIYRTLPITELERHDRLVRVIDNEGEDYLYDRDYFEPVDTQVTGERESGLVALTIHLPPLVKAILHAEALAVHKSASALVRSGLTSDWTFRRTEGSDRMRKRHELPIT